MKNIGKPCAGKPHARFDEGGQARACSLLYPMFLRFLDLTAFYRAPCCYKLILMSVNLVRNSEQIFQQIAFAYPDAV